MNVFHFLIVPSESHGNPIPVDVRERVLNRAARVMSCAFGGVTMTEAVGAWWSAERNQLVQEAVTRLESWGSLDDVHTLADLAEDVRCELAQEAVMFGHVTGGASFVT